MYSSLRPYIGNSDGILAMVAQVQIFVSLLSSIALKTNPNSPAMTVILVGLVFIPPAFAIVSEFFDSYLTSWVVGDSKDPSSWAR